MVLDFASRDSYELPVSLKLSYTTDMFLPGGQPHILRDHVRIFNFIPCEHFWLLWALIMYQQHCLFLFLSPSKTFYLFANFHDWLMFRVSFSVSQCTVFRPINSISHIHLIVIPPNGLLSLIHSKKIIGYTCFIGRVVLSVHRMKNTVDRAVP